MDVPSKEILPTGFDGARDAPFEAIAGHSSYNFDGKECNVRQDCDVRLRLRYLDPISIMIPIKGPIVFS